MNLAKDFKNLALFNNLQSVDLDKLQSVGNVKKFPAGHYLVKESDGTDSKSPIYLITQGRVDITISLVSSEETKHIATLTKGEVVGEFSLLGKRKRSANVIAKVDIEAIVWERDKILDFFEENERIGYYIMQNLAVELSERLDSTNQIIRNFFSSSSNFFI